MPVGNTQTDAFISFIVLQKVKHCILLLLFQYKVIYDKDYSRELILLKHGHLHLTTLLFLLGADSLLA
jgi:hypothetical protein